MLVSGKWTTDWQPVQATDGRGGFVRQTSTFRNWVTPDGAAGPTGEGGFRAQAGRYHLYAALICPWATRVLIARRLKRLETVVSVAIVEPALSDQGWRFGDTPGADRDVVNGATFLHEIYTRADPDFTGRATVPALWDRERRTIVNNESADLLRIMNSGFGALADDSIDLCPADLREGIDAVNAAIYPSLNNGVYRAGFATTQEAYEEAIGPLFETLDWLDARLTDRRFLCGDAPTEADWRLYTTLVRFDPVYVGHFKCNIRRIADYPALSGYLRDLHQWPGVAPTVDMVHIKGHYYESHRTINPTGIVPVGPVLDLTSAPGREHLARRAR